MSAEHVRIVSDSVILPGTLSIPAGAVGVVVFAHGSGSSRFSPRNIRVAQELEKTGIGTLLFDLLSPDEAENQDLVFDVGFLANRLRDATNFLRSRTLAGRYPIGYFGASTGAAAALIAAAHDHSIRAVVSRGGRPDLAMDHLAEVKAPTLLIVGGADYPVIDMNRSAFKRLKCEKAMEIVPGATHLFEEPGTMEKVELLACAWLLKHLKNMSPLDDDDPPEGDDEVFFLDRADAGRRLASRLQKYQGQSPVVLGIPRGGVPVAFEVARALQAPLDVIVVRKIGAPDEPELGIGAVVDGDHPDTVLNDKMVEELGVKRSYLDREVKRQIEEIHRRQLAYRGGRARVDLRDRTAIVVDDGIATGGSIRAALRGIRRAHPRRIVLAVPVAPAETINELRSEADDIVCLGTPPFFYAIGQFYRDFHQLRDDEVIGLLAQVNSSTTAARL